MIPRAIITNWRNEFPWESDLHVEQDLVICRSLVEIYSDELLAEQLDWKNY